MVGRVVGVVGKWDKYLSSTGTSILRMPQMAPKGLQTYVGAPERGGATWGSAPTRPKLPRGGVYFKGYLGHVGLVAKRGSFSPH